MFYFVFKIVFYLLIIYICYYILNKKSISILEILILLFIFNICLYSLYNNITILNTILLSLIIIISYYLYLFLYNKNILNKEEGIVLVNRGIINFSNLIKENLTYDNLIYELNKKGIKNPDLVDYCIKKNNDFIVFKSNSIKNYPISLIIDGKILKDNVFSIHKSIEWINNKIDDNNLELKSINYAYYKNKEIYFITN